MGKIFKLTHHWWNILKTNFHLFSSNINSYQEVISYCIPVMSWWCFTLSRDTNWNDTFVSGSGLSLHVALSPILKGPFSKNYRDLCFGNYQADITNVKMMHWILVSFQLLPKDRDTFKWKQCLYSSVSLGTNLGRADLYLRGIGEFFPFWAFSDFA